MCHLEETDAVSHKKIQLQQEYFTKVLFQKTDTGKKYFKTKQVYMLLFFLLFHNLPIDVI